MAATLGLTKFGNSVKFSTPEGTDTTQTKSYSGLNYFFDDNVAATMTGAATAANLANTTQDIWIAYHDESDPSGDSYALSDLLTTGYAIVTADVTRSNEVGGLL